MTKFTVLLLVAAFPSMAIAAGFDCARAATAVEKLICADRSLSKSDEELSARYQSSLAGSSDPATLKNQQRDWLLNVRNRCTNAACLQEAYASRIAQISSGRHSTISEKRFPSAGDLWVTNGGVDAIAYPPDGATVYIGGAFNLVGPRTGSFVAINRSNGQIAGNFPRVDGEVYVSIPDGAGGLYIGGHFSRVGDVSRRSLAHVFANGAVDPDFNPNLFVTSSVSAIVKIDNTLYLGGNIFMIDKQRRNNLAAINAKTGRVLPWNPDVNKSVETLAVSGDTLYAGGFFTTVNGEKLRRSKLAAFNIRSGAVTSWNPDIESSDFTYIRSLVVTRRMVIVGGKFATVGGQKRNNIAAVDPVTGGVMAWDPSARGADANDDGVVRTLAASDSTVYVGGDFKFIGGQARAYLVALDVVSGRVTSWNPQPDAGLWSLTLSGNTLYAGGWFTTIGGQARNKMAALDVATGTATDWNPNANGPARSLVVSGDMVYAGGWFTSVNGNLPRVGIAALDVATGKVRDWNPGIEGSVGALAMSGDILYIGGSFMSVGGQGRGSLAAVDTRTGALTTWNPGAYVVDYKGDTTEAEISALLISGNKTYVGGNFSSVGNQPHRGIVALDLASGRPDAWDANIDGMVHALALSSGNTLYVAGEFERIGNKQHRYLAAFDASTGKPTAWKPDADGAVKALAISGSTLYVGGEFTHIGGQERFKLAALNVTTGKATAWNPGNASSGAGSHVETLTVSGKTVYAGGAFLALLDDAEGTDIAALDAATGKVIWNPRVDGIVYTVTVLGNRVSVGGTFKSANGQVRSNFAILER